MSLDLLRVSRADRHIDRGRRRLDVPALKEVDGGGNGRRCRGCGSRLVCTSFDE